MFANPIPFEYLYNTVNLSASATSSNVALPVQSNPPLDTVMVYNSGTSDVFINFGTSNSVTASATLNIPIPAKTVMTFSLRRAYVYAAAVTATGTSVVYFTIGKGN